ncbi:MAG: hypothetical protein A2Y00_03650 [Omnitrophica WOR_2 bacterium GWF2_43_52]|nr:MAG: hypothetical protein A2Y00_03650 [Omnitrophica WOR_2 bacterium GWF2_43_52]HAH21468.1 glycosyltransferase family 2 protein [Candidatus Omnitrophota bacterium]HBG64616.1 glycosyltransferase family 2 protein [Candidatus Omnitrophota bacterium]
MVMVFWGSIAVILYTYLGYPLIVYLISLFYRQPVKRSYPYPTVTIVMAVYNEEKNIERKMQSLLELDYPSSRVEILIGSDGSTDNTHQILSRYTNERIKLYCQANRQGKPCTLNMLAKQAQGELLVFTDARQRLDKSSIDELVKNFADPKVGSVSAELYFEADRNKTAQGMGIYWNYEKLIRKYESRTGSMMGATGALYAIRRDLFPELPQDLILDDVYIPMKIVERGYRTIFDKKAKLYDRYSVNPREEFSRKCRTLAGNYQLITYLPWLLNPFKNKISWQFISHKFLRLMVPFLMIILFTSTLFLAQAQFYKTALFIQSIFYGLALIGGVVKIKNSLIDIPHMFCVMNFAALIGCYRFLSHKQAILWEKTA